MFKNISVIGLGYIGLPTATLFAAHGKQVIGVDINPHVVDTINQGKIHIVEPELESLVKDAVRRGYLRASLQVEPADAFLLAVPTPLGHSDPQEGSEHTWPQPDLRFVRAAVLAIAPVLRKGNLIILESTIPVGTTERMAAWLAEVRPDLSFPQQEGEKADIHIAHCPERVLPGKVVTEIVSNDRVIGGMTKQASYLARRLYKIFVTGECIITGVRTAELCKLAENTYRDINIAYANELSMICDSLNVDVWELIRLANRHPRVDILRPGAGVGGHCIAVDPWFLVNSAQNQAPLARVARHVNNQKPEWIISKIKEAITDLLTISNQRCLSDVVVACLGLTFKPDIDDIRESPALMVVKQIASLGCTVIIVEPHVKALPNLKNDVKLRMCSLKEAYREADIICRLVDHKIFKESAVRLNPSQKLINFVSPDM